MVCSCLEQLESFSCREPVRCGELRSLGPDPLAERVETRTSLRVLVRDPHRRTQLTAVFKERRDLRLQGNRDVLHVIDGVGFEQQDRARPVRRQSETGEEQRIACRDDPVGEKESGVAMVGVEAVTLPRIVTEQDVRGDRSDLSSDLALLVSAGLELPVGPSEEDDLGGPAQDMRRGALFRLPRGDELGRVPRGVPAPLRTVGADEVEGLAPVARPLGECATAAKLDVVRVRGDRERTSWGRQVRRHLGGATWGAKGIAACCADITSSFRQRWSPGPPCQAGRRG